MNFADAFKDALPNMEKMVKWVAPKLELDMDPDDFDQKTLKPIVKPMYGTCIIEINLKNHGEYLSWVKYEGGRKWEFVHTYPAIMRAEYNFHSSLEVEMLAKKIVHLLEMGFDVYSARWRLAKEKSQLEQRL